MAHVKRTSHFTSTELTNLRAALEQYVVSLRTELDLTEGEVSSHLGEGMAANGDDADRGSLAEDLQVSSTLAVNSEHLLAQCQHALDRIASQQYGECDQCGRPIAKARLQALPHATLCISCQNDVHA